MARTRFSGPVASDNGFEGAIEAGYVQLDTTNVNNVGIGKIVWDATDETIDLGLDANVTLKIGQATYYLTKNQSGSTIPKGSVVRADGAVGGSARIKIVLSQASVAIPPIYSMGIAAEDIPDGDDGFILEFGALRQINTTGGVEDWQDGDVLYISGTTAGSLTNVAPAAPTPSIIMAIVLRAANNGSIFVRPTFGETLDQLHNVSISDPQNGDVLKYNSSTGVWYNAAP
jgi:hypothetical protein